MCLLNLVVSAEATFPLEPTLMRAGPGLAGVMVMKDHLSYKHGAWKGLEVEQRDPRGQERKETLGTRVFLTMVLPSA